jgi:hypothetical protein|tara:strand:- start:42 stop:224 length:183 start_codon:yes stop_codon:yes gene_type:complete
MAISRSKTGKQVTPKLGSGKRFKKLAKKTSPALAAYIGRKKYGKKKFQKLSAKGKNRKAT